MTSELHRPVPLDRVGEHAWTVEVEADEAECEAVARRLGIPAVQALKALFRLSRDPADPAVIQAEARLAARLVRDCVVTLEPFEATVAEAFQLRFIPADREPQDDDPESVDEISYAGREIDLGEATVEQLALTLDPYPRAPGAQLPEEASEAAASPFDALRARLH